MLPNQKGSVRFVALLAMLWSITAATTNLCTVLNGITRRPLTTAVDGFSYDFFTDLRKFIETQNCDPSSPVVLQGSETPKSDIIYSSNGVSGTVTKIQYYVKATSVKDNLFDASATITLDMTLTKNGKSNPATASFGFDARGIVTDLAGRFPPTWQGSLKTTGSSGLGVFDDDLFDGAGAVVVDDVSRGSEPTAEDLKQAKDIAVYAADVNQRFRNFESVPTALSGDVTARLAFPSAKIIVSVDGHKNGTSGFVASAHGECRGDKECGVDAVTTLGQLAAADTECKNPSLMADSMYGSLRATVGIENQKVFYVVGVRGTISGVFSCSNGGYIGISLGAVADADSALQNNGYSLRLFKEDARAAITQIKSIKMQALGRRYGYVSKGDESIMTPVETDMFGYGRGGSFIDDVVIDDSSVSKFQTSVSSIASLLSGKYPAVNDVFAAMCDPKSTAEIAKRYFAQTAHPTSYGLWSFWAEQFNGFAIARDTVQNKLILEINSHIHSEYKYESEDPSVESFNTVLSTVNNKVKEACGSACSSLTGTPVLDSESIKSSSIGIAVSAAVSIPTSTLSRAAEKSNDAQKQIKLFRRKHAINGAEDVHMEFVAQVTASLGSQNSTLGEVSIMYSSIFKKATMVKGSLVSLVTGVAQPVGMGINGQVFFNVNVDSSLLPTFANSFGAAASSIFEKEGKSLQSLTQLNDHATSQSISQLLTSIASSLPKSGSMSVMSYLDSMRNLLEKSLVAAGVIPFLSLSFSDSAKTISVDLTYVTVRRIGFEASGVYWAKNIPISRTQLTLPLASIMSFTVGNSGSVKSFQIQGYSHAQGFSLPVREGMRVGLATAGYAETVINVPSYSYLTVTFNGKMDRGSTFSGVFKGNMSINDENVKLGDLFSFEMTEDNRGGYAQQADPSATLAAFADNFMFPSTIGQHQLNEKLTPFGKPLREIIDLESSWKNRTAWIFSNEPFPFVFVQSVSFPMAGFSETVNITVNSGYDFNNCVFNIPSATKPEELVESMSKAVASCGDLSSFVRVDFTDSDNSEYNIIMTPIYAGSIYSFIVTSAPESQSLMRSQSWAASRVTPDHLSWNDLYNGVYLALLKPTPSYDYAKPAFSKINVAQANLVDSSRAKFYPTELPGVFFNAAVKYHNPASKIPILPEFDSIDNNVTINVASKNAVVDGDVSMSMTFGMAFWCSLGDGSLPLSTAFSDVEGNRYSDVKVPNAPDNTFTFVATAEKRLASARDAVPELVTLSEKITLTPGKLLFDAFLNEIPAQLSGLSKKMITVENHTDETYTQDRQAVIHFNVYQPDDDTLYVPLEFTVNPTNLVGFGSPTSYSQIKAMTSCPLSKNYKLDIQLKSVPSFDNDADSLGLGDTTTCTGTFGVTEISDCNAQLTIDFNFSVSGSKSIALLGDMHNVIPDSIHFSDWYNNVASLSTVVSVNGLSFNVANNKMSTLGSEYVYLNKKLAIPFNQLKNASDSVYAVSIPSTTPTGHALASLLTSNKETFCAGLKETLDKVNLYALTDEMNQILPFTNQHMSPIYETLINEHVEEAMNSVCDVTNDRVNTVTDFCDELKNEFGFSVCGNLTLSDDGLDIPLLINPETAYAPVAFQFDSKRLIRNATFSSAYGDSGDLVLDATVGASVGMKFAFKEDGGRHYTDAILVADKTKFTSKVALNSAPRIKTLLGSTVVTFDSQALYLDISISGGIDDFSDDVEVSLSGGARLDAHAQNDDSSYYCHVTADVPVVRHYFYPPPDALEDTVTFSDNCLKGNFVRGVEESFDYMTIARYFEQNPGNFFKQFNEKLAKDLLDRILDDITNKAVAFLGKNIQALCSRAFDRIVGPDVSSQIATQITDMVAKIIKSGKYPNAADLERAVLTFFTGALNKIFKPILRQQIPVPNPGSTIVWEFRLGGENIKEIKGIDWSCGDHGVADLEVTTTNKLKLDWKVDFNVVWNKTAGISITWPNKPAMSGSVSLVDTRFDLSGSLLFISADLAGSLYAKAELSANPNNKDVKFNVDASMDTNGKIGLVKKIRQETKGEKKNALGALPYVSAGIKASWSFKWGTGNPKPTMPTTFQITNPQLCLGSIITEFMQQVSREVDRILKPLDPIFGPDGILLKPIPGLSKILGNHCNVLAILEWTCSMFSSSCNIKTVRKLIEVLSEVAADIGKIKKFMEIFKQPDGCMDFGYIYKTFNISWSKKDPTPDDPARASNGIIPMTPTEKFYDSVPSAQRQGLRDIMRKWSPAGTSVIRGDCVNCTEAEATIVNGGNGFGFKLDILEKFPVKLISILLGANVPLFSVSFPEASVSYGISWTIPVWTYPYVAVKIHAGATVAFKPPSVALMSNGIIDTVKTGNPSHLFRNLAVSTKTSFATGTLEVDGGAEGGINVVIAKVTVNFDIVVKFIVEAKVANFNGEEWITFDTISMQVRKYGFNGAIHFNLQLRGGFKLYLRACINVFFWKKCWNIVGWYWDTPLWSWSPKYDLIKPVCSSGGAIDKSSWDFNYPVSLPSGEDEGKVGAKVSIRTYTVTDTAVMFMPPGTEEGNAGLTRSVPRSSGVSFSGLPCTSEYNVIINGDIHRPSIFTASCQKMNLKITQRSYSDVNSFTIDWHRITPEKRGYIGVTRCASVRLEKPNYGTKYIFSGSPECPTFVETDGSVVNLTGNAQNYGPYVTFTGDLRKVYVAMACKNFVIGTKSIKCDSANFNIPAGVSVIRVGAIDPNPPKPRPKPKPTPFDVIVESVPSNRSVQIIGADSRLKLSVPDMKNMSGFVSFVGNSADENFVNIDMDTPEDKDMYATAFPSHVAYNDSDDNDAHILRHANAGMRNYSLRAAPGRKSTMHLVSPDDYDSVVINLIGAEGSTVRQEIDGCGKRSGVSVNMTGEGAQTIVLGTDGTLGKLHCSLHLSAFGETNEKNSAREVIVNATLESRPLNWVFTDSEFSVANSLDSSDIFHVFTTGMDHITVHFSKKSANTLLIDKADNDGTEYVFVFPENDEGRDEYSTVQISQSKSPILMSGPVANVVLGDQYGGYNPLSQLQGVVVAPSGSNIIMSAETSNSPIHMAISENCLLEQSSSISKPSDWFINTMMSFGVKYKEGCNILVPVSSNGKKNAGFSTTFDIVGSTGNDTIEAMNPSVNVVANMGDGDDSVTWLSPESTASLFLQMGDGADSLSVQSAGSVNLDLGADDKPDHVTVVCKDGSPSIIRSTVFPIGVPGSDARMEISNWDGTDTLEISRYSISSPKVRETAVIAPDVEGAKIIYQQNSNTDYSVKACTDKSVLSFTTAYQGFYRAVNTNVAVVLESYDPMCAISIDNVPQSNGIVTVGVDSNALVVPNQMTLSSGSLEFGNVGIVLGNVDHLGVEIDSAYYKDGGVVTVSGTPALQDIFINLPRWRTVVSEDVKNLTIMTVHGDAEVKNLDLDADGIVIAIGNMDSSTHFDLKSSSLKDVTIVNGCIESSKKRTISEWMINQARELGIEITSGQKCAAVLKSVRYLMLNGESCKTAYLSGLGWKSIRSVYACETLEKVVLESVNTETKDSLWIGATMSDNDFMVSKMNDDAFHVTMHNSKGTVSVGSPVFAPYARMYVNCSNPAYHYTWNVAMDKSRAGSKLRSYYTDVNFTSNGRTCSGRINNRIFASMESAPSVTLIPGIGASVLVEITGSKNATSIDRYVNLSNSEGMNRLHFYSFDLSSDEADFVWDPSLGGKVTVHLGDRSQNVIVVNPNATKKNALYLNAAVHSSLSFPNIGNNSISFEGVTPAHYNSGSKSFDLVGGKKNSDIFCFQACDMCSSETWEEIRVLGRSCSVEKEETAKCAKDAMIHVSQENIEAMLTVSCGNAKWDPTAKSSTQCGIAYNANGAEKEYTNVIPAVCKILAAIVVFVSAVATVLGASVLLSRVSIAFGKSELPNVNRWWLSNMMRDFFNDQFSWASVVLTACLGGVSNFDISNWGGPIDGLVLQTKSLVLDWLNFCDSVYSPLLIVTWAAAFVTLVMRIITAVGDSKASCSGFLNWMKPIHSLVSCLTLLLLPFAGYAIPVLMTVNVPAGLLTLVFAIAIIASVPMEKFSSTTTVRNIASYASVSIPFLASIVAGIGASRALILAMLLVCSIILPVCNTFVLWKLFFAGADTRTHAWKSSLFWTFGLRAASLICGVIFFSILFFELSSTASGFAYAFWFLWVVLPPIQLIPLVLSTKFSNIIPRDYRSSLYGPINSGETTPLRASEAASLPSISALPVDKDLSDVAAA